MLKSQEGKHNNPHKSHRRQSFSDAKKDFKRKVLVTYDIHENKKEAYLIQLIDALASDPIRLKTMNNHMLPITTPTARIDELIKKLNEKKNKKAEKKLKKKKEKAGQDTAVDEDGDNVAVKLKDMKKQSIMNSIRLEDIEELDAEVKNLGSNKNSN